jgi:hypothetical protein
MCSFFLSISCVQDKHRRAKLAERFVRLVCVLWAEGLGKMAENVSNRGSLPEAYYEPLAEDIYRATAATMSPWDSALQHGGPPTALLATAIDRFQPKPDMRLARITVDYLGPVPLTDVEIVPRIIRPGKRVELLESVMKVGAKDVAVARAWRISFAANRARDIGIGAPPAIPAEQEQELFEGLTDWGYGEAAEWRFLRGGFNQLGPVEIWSRLRIPLIKGEELTGLQRMLVIADSANGLSAELPFLKHLFIPPSIDVTLLRYPVGEWTFMRAKTVMVGDGIGMAEGHLYDETSLVAMVSQPLLVAPR